MKKLWKIHRHLWRSPDWLRFVRSLPCCCRLAVCPNCSGGIPEQVEAHHVRYGPQVGMGRKPDDFLALPLSPAVHSLVHLREAMPLRTQYLRLLDVWSLAESCGFLSASPYGSYFPPPESDPCALPRMIEQNAAKWREAFVRKQLRLCDPSRIVPPSQIDWGFV